MLSNPHTIVYKPPSGGMRKEKMEKPSVENGKFRFLALTRGLTRRCSLFVFLLIFLKYQIFCNIYNLKVLLLKK